MGVFAYKASEPGSPGGRKGAIDGTIVADTPRQARDLLRDKGLWVHRIQQQRPSLTNSAWRPWKGLVSRRRAQPAKVVAFVRELSTLLGVGLPLLEAIDTLTQQHTGDFRASLLLLKDRIAAGVSLAEAMAQQPAMFDELSVHMAEIGESAGTLDVVLARLADFKERASQFRGKVGTALLYPCIVLTLAIGISVALMTFVVPKLLSALLEAGRPLPWVTKMVKGCSDLLVERGWLLLIGVAIFLLTILAILRTQRGRLMWHRLQLRLPVAGAMLRKQAVVRIAMVVSTLMRSGIVFVKAIQIAQRSSPNLVIRDALARCEAAVIAGRDIAPALKSTGVFPPLVIQIFSVGQQSGRLEEMLERLGTDYDLQLATAAQRLTAVLEPVLILFLVVVVGFIAFATVLPLLEAANVL